jgi:hypothetical protein
MIVMMVAILVHHLIDTARIYSGSSGVCAVHFTCSNFVLVQPAGVHRLLKQQQNKRAMNFKLA